MNTPPLFNHPDDNTLDQLRAGLLADSATLRAHVADCTVCQRRLTAWDRLAETMRATISVDSALARQLRARRQAALAGRANGRAVGERRWAPQYLAMAAAVATLAIGLSVFVTLDRNAPDATPDTLSAQADGASDIYADIDFYLWLTSEELTKSATGNAS